MVARKMISGIDRYITKMVAWSDEQVSAILKVLCCPPRDPSHIQTPNPDSIADAKKCLLTGA